MRQVKCDVCGKVINLSDAYDENGHTTQEGYVNIEIRESRDYAEECDLCVTCIDRVIDFVNELKKEAENDSKR